MTFRQRARWVTGVCKLWAVVLVGCTAQGSSANAALGDGGGSPDAGALAADAQAMPTALPPIDPKDGFSVDEGEFTIQPGEEYTYCVRIPIPERFAGKDLAMLGYDSDVPKQTHHFFMAYKVDSNIKLDPNAGPVPCDGKNALVPIANGSAETLGGGKLVIGAGVGLRVEQGLQPDRGMYLAKGGHLITNHHVLNLSTKPAKMYARFNVYVRPATEVAHLENEFNCLSLNVTLQPHQRRDVTATCTVPFDLDLTLVASHAHQHLESFEAHVFDGQKTLPEVIYESDVWDNPKLQRMKTPLALKKGQGITFTCHYFNASDKQVVFGVGPDSEMCASMDAYSLPAGHDHEIPPPLGTLITANSAPLADTTNSPVPFF
jgi:hypothetical protein